MRRRRTLDDLEPFKDGLDSSNRFLGSLFGSHVFLGDVGFCLAPYLLGQHGRISWVVVHPPRNGGFNEASVDRNGPVRVGGILPIGVRFDVRRHYREKPDTGLFQILVEIVRPDETLQQIFGGIDILGPPSG